MIKKLGKWTVINIDEQNLFQCFISALKNNNMDHELIQSNIIVPSKLEIQTSFNKVFQAARISFNFQNESHYLREKSRIEEAIIENVRKEIEGKIFIKFPLFGFFLIISCILVIGLLINITFHITDIVRDEDTLLYFLHIITH
ncbi:MAG: hypothetical protein ACTSRG_04720 [Candidatus Helarchaeota archaeon]